MEKLYLLLLIPAFRFLININNWWFVKKVLKKHDVYIQGVFDEASQEEKVASNDAANWIRGKTLEITRVYSLTGRDQPIESYMDTAGYGHVQQKRLNILENLLFQNSDVIQQGRSCLEIAKGYFWTNAMHSINPIYWIEVIFFLPKVIMSASGIDATNKIADIGVKVVQILYWLAVVAAFIFKPEIFNFLLDNGNT
ncbi:hypothetical protein M6C35_003655 [Vibrio metschnikovii]|nr:hypothetical protein [Vibrio metschnikovii]EKO3715632.1 hypothetical protein [Vibrio metschnikovii]